MHAMVCTCLPEAMLMNSTTLTMTWMALSRTALLGLSNLCNDGTDVLGEQKQHLSDQGVSSVLKRVIMNVPST